MTPGLHCRDRGHCLHQLQSDPEKQTLRCCRCEYQEEVSWRGKLLATRETCWCPRCLSVEKKKP